MQTVSVAISVIAVLVSGLSAWNSVRQVRTAQRTRFGQLVDAITKEDEQFDRLMDEVDEKITETTEINYRTRKEILARQALSLRTGRHTSSREVAVLAGCLDYLQDYEQADRMYRKAVGVARREGPVYVAGALTEYGLFLFASGSFERGSATLRDVVDALAEPVSDHQRRQRVRALVLVAVMHFRNRYEIEAGEAFLAEAESVAAGYRLDGFRSEFQQDLREYRAELRAARRGAPADPQQSRPGRRR